MHNKLLITIILLFSILVTGCNLQDTPKEEIISNKNICNPGAINVIGDISFKILEYGIGDKMMNTFERTTITKNDIIYNKDELTNENGGLLNGKVYININSMINNATNKTINVDLKEFYLVVCNDKGEIIRGSTNPRYAYLKSTSKNAKLDNLNLVLQPNGKATVQLMYIEDLNNITSHGCYFRVKSKNDIAFLNIYNY